MFPVEQSEIRKIDEQWYDNRAGAVGPACRGNVPTITAENIAENIAEIAFIKDDILRKSGGLRTRGPEAASFAERNTGSHSLCWQGLEKP